ncbi:MAG: exo-alpha-sialidase [Phycisphaerae bacterium]|nr:exo-alpha-sialidase [Phycisphaerae bacterium]
MAPFFCAAVSFLMLLSPTEMMGAVDPDGAVGNKPEIRVVARIWDTGGHNAFTDLLRFDGRWLCVFREAEAHVYGRDGQIRVICSKDGETWESAAILGEKGVDLRDPKISLAPDGRLMIVMGGSVYDGRTLVTRQSRVAFSSDGRSWSQPQKVLSAGEWLWRVTWRGNEGFGVAYGGPSGSGESPLRLYRTENGSGYELVTPLEVQGAPNETTLRFAADGQMIALVRREAGDTRAWIGSSSPPFTRWQWRQTQHQIGGPNFVVLPDGQMWAAGRSYTGGAKTAVGRLTKGGYEPMLTVPSGGDTSYPGLAWHDGLLWMSYYSSHEGKAAIYLAKIALAAD